MHTISDGTRAYCPPFTPMYELLERAESAHYKLVDFDVEEEAAQFENMRAAFAGWDADIRPGHYMKLTGNGHFWMSDTPRERRSMLGCIYEAHGAVLIGGLGLGALVVALLNKPEVTVVHVIEIDREIIELVGEQLLSKYDKLIITQADVLTWKPPKGEVYNTIYFDIWPNISADNWPDMTKLHRRYWHYLDRTDPKRYLSSWEREWTESLVRQERRESWRW